MTDLLQLFSGNGGFMPHGMCYLWEPGLLWVHVVSDALIWLAYWVIPPVLIYLIVRARREVPQGADYAERAVPYDWMFWAFGLFIIACGGTHLMNVWTVWNPDYWFSGAVKAATAVASVATAVALPPLIPRVLELVRDARTSEFRRQQLEESNVELERLNRELREKERELQRTEQRFRELAERIEDVFWISSPDKSHVVYVSPAYETVFGRPREELYEHPGSWLDAVVPEDRDRVETAARRQAEEEYEEEYRIERAGGEVRWIRDRAFPVTGEDGRVLRIVGVAEDTTERKETERKLAQGQRMETVGRLAGGIAHEFNNLLTVITNFSEIMLEDLSGEHHLHHDLGQIRVAADRAASLTRQLLAYSRKQILQPRDLDLTEVVGDTQRMLRRIISENIELEFLPAQDLPTVHVDPGQVEQVVVNLAINARDAMPQGGTLTVATAVRSVPLREARDAGVEPGDYVVLSVRDTGVGMDAATRAAAFDPFFTTKPAGEGTGLGLSTVHGIVTQSGGFIEVESAIGEGSVFRIHLPVQTAGDSRGPAPAGPSSRPSGQATILLVEDEDAVRAVAKRVLERSGYRVLDTKHGEEALEVFSDPPVPIDLVLTDLVMPVMGGVALADAIGKIDTAMPVLFMSGYAEGEMLPQRYTDKDMPLLPKPFTIEQLVGAVARRLQWS